MGKGYIRLYRQLQDCWIWRNENEPERFTRGQAWVDLLLLANHKDKKMSFNDGFKIIQRGQYFTSKSKLAERWMWNRRTVDKFLKLLEKDEMITIECTSRYTLITIINYDIYQGEGTSSTQVDAQVSAQHPAQHTTQHHAQECSTNNNDNNVNNVNNENNNIYCSLFEETYKVYPRKGDKQKAYKCYQARLKEGYSEEELMTATKNYAAYCEKEKREQKYIKLASTFFGVNTPFVDYLKGDNHSGNESNTTSDSGTSKVEYTEEQRQAARDYLSGVQRGGLFD